VSAHVATLVQEETVTTTASAPLLTVADVCGRLRMGKSKVFEFIATGELESLKLDGSRRVTEEQLADFIARRAAASKVPA
jgi:excisionase family DNA binding protein